MRSFFFLGIIWCLVQSPCFAQFSNQESNTLKPYFEGFAFYESGYYALAQESFERFLEAHQNVDNPKTINQVQEAKLHIAKCALYQNSPLAEHLFQEFINNNKPSPQANEAVYDLTNYYFEAKNYDACLKYYEWLDFSSLGGSVKNETYFKKGYSHFVRRQYQEAIDAFSKVGSSDYYADACYFAGHSQYELGNYEQAIGYWKIAATSPKYEESVPYSIAQVYFAEGDYDQLVLFAKPYLNKRGSKNLKALRQLVGKSYFELGEYQEAYPLLEDYAEQRGRMTIEDYYQLGYARYTEGDYKGAADAFVKLDGQKSSMGQSAMYYLADCYTKMDDKASARNAFYRVSQLDFDTELQEESLLYYAKISAELGFDIEALKALLRFTASSKNYVETQAMIIDILERTKDTKRALNLLENLDNLTPDLKKAHQIVSYRQGERELSLNNPYEAKDYLLKSLQYPINNKLKALANYWLGEIFFQQRNYEESKARINDYLALDPESMDMPTKATPGLAYYNQAYNYMKLEDYPNAEKYFQQSFAALPGSGLPEDLVVDLVSDAGLRLADSYFKRKRYNEALSIYNENIDRHYDNEDYAIYQKAIILGLQQRSQGKIDALESLLASYPNSSYADDALLELGDTYAEIGNYGRALNALENLVKNYKGKSALLPQAYLELGLINYNQDRVDLALTYYKKVFDNNPSSDEARNALAAIQEIYMIDKKDPDAFIAFSQKVTGSKTSVSARDSLNYEVGYTLYEEGQYEQAIKAFDEYLIKFKRGLNRTDAYFYKSECHSILKQYDKAVEGYEACILAGQNSYFEDCLEKAALIHYNYTEDFRRAYQHFTELEQITTLEDRKNEAQIGAFRSAYRLGLDKETVIYANKVIKNPKASEDLKITARFYLGKIDYDNKRYSKAVDYLEPVAKNGTGENQAEARYLIASVAYNLQQLDVAEMLTREAMSQNGAYPYWVAKSLILLSDILVAKEDFFNAKAALDAVIENYQEDAEILNEATQKKSTLEALEARANDIYDPNTKPSSNDN